VKTSDTDEQDDELVADWGSEFRCGDKRILGIVVQKTKTDWCRRGLWQTCYCLSSYILCLLFFSSYNYSQNLVLDVEIKQS